jgi:hypothetical protein
MFTRAKLRIQRFIRALRKPRPLSEREILILQLQDAQKKHKRTRHIQSKLRAITHVQLRQHIARVP